MRETLHNQTIGVKYMNMRRFEIIEVYLRSLETKDVRHLCIDHDW